MLETLLSSGILPMIGYSLGIYFLTGAIKKSSKMIPRLHKAITYYVSVVPVIIGMISGPLVMPFLFQSIGAPGGEEIPLSLSIFLGASAAGVSKILWDLVNKVIRQHSDEG